MASYKVLIKKSAAKELEAIAGRKDRERIARRIFALADNPRPGGVEKLSGTSEKYRIRQGNFRILYEIQDDILVVKIADRKEHIGEAAAEARNLAAGFVAGSVGSLEQNRVSRWRD